ncbi:MAG: DUF998 domain-containing protein [Anaerolineaceae bacterium]
MISVGIVPTAIVDRGVNGQRYSLLNHYISELGEVGVSTRAGWFNDGMILTGMLFLPFTTGLGLALGNPWAYLAILAGLWAGVSCLLVGLYPMNNLTPHARVATSYFRGGLATILLFTVAIFFQTPGKLVISRWANLAGLAAILSYASFIGLADRHKPDETTVSFESEPVVKDRPRFRLIPTLEWLVFIITILWFLLVALCA